MMPSAPPKLAKVCKECGAKNPGHLTQCWLCGGSLTVPAAGTPFKPTSYERSAAFQFSCASLLVTTALIAVVLGVFRLAPGLGILLAVTVAPAWIHTCVMVASKSSGGGKVTLAQKAGTFAASVAIMIGSCALIIAVFIAAVVGAFAVVCGSAASPEPRRVAGTAVLVALGAAVVIGVGVVVVRAVWRYPRQSGR